MWRSAVLLLTLAGCKVESVQLRDKAAPQSLSVLQLWNGEESTDVLDATSLLDGNLTGRHAEPPVQSVQLFGLFNTGTNLLYQLLQHNFQGRVRMPEKVWKHVSLRRYFERVPEAADEFRTANTVAVAVVREPLSWLQSVHKAPYNLERCSKQPSWLTAPCPFVSPEWHPPHGILFNDIEEYWNENTGDYNRLSDFGFQRSMVVRYEDIVMNTEGVIDRLAQLLQLDAPKALQQIDGPAKDGGACLGRQQAIAKLTTKDYLRQYHGREKADACERLDANLMSQHGYGDCGGETSS
eukprot:TRINITY_DN40618_c0_g1_i1.p1 TRINITY_DN40618_c0_g1~~TRINITY_DN40618_c0_g1_i1.p1  ORF type:complete len:295 (-),score=69.17 TRINITY_DN40618_c0_g1_i1:50-934(-)